MILKTPLDSKIKPVKKLIALIITFKVQFSSVAQSCLFVTPWTTGRQASLSITNSNQLQEFTQTHVHWVGDVIQPLHPLSSHHFTLCHPLLLLSLIFPSIMVFSNESALHIRWPKYWSFSFNTSPDDEHPGLISFRMDLFDLLAVQGTLKSSPTPQLKSINSSVLSFLYSPTLTSIHDYWKNHSFD